MEEKAKPHRLWPLVVALIIIVFAISAFILFQPAPTPEEEIPEVYEVSIGEINANPGQYEGKQVRTSGTLSTYYGAGTIHYLYDEENSIELTFPAMNPSSYEGENIEITGYVRVENTLVWIEVANVQETTTSLHTAAMGFEGSTADPAEYEIIVILIEFQDFQHSPDHDINYFRNLFFDNTPNANSMYNYYREVSYGQVSISGTVVGWYTSAHNKVYYGQDSAARRDDANTNRYELAREAVQLADADVDFSQFDKDGDGVVDHAAVVFAGESQAWSRVADDIWSHRWEIPRGERVDGVEVENYTAQAENNRLATYAHEFGHDLGLPDLYDTNNRQEFAGHWALMASGTLLNNGNTPPHFTSWSKLKLGWISQASVKVVQRNQTERITIKSLNRRPSQTGFIPSVVKVPITNSTYYLIEVRRQVGYDSALPDHGVLIYWCDDRKDSGQGPVRVVDANPDSPPRWDTDDAPYDSQFAAGENFLFEDNARNVSVTVLLTVDGHYAVDVSSGAPAPNYSAVISYASPSSFNGGERTRVTVHIWNIGDAATLRVSPANIPEGWVVEDDEADADNDKTIQLNPLAYESLDFFVTPPLVGGTATLTWELYGPGPDSQLLDTYEQSVTATFTISPALLAAINSISEENLIGGEDTLVTASLTNFGDLGTLIITPENIPEGWIIGDIELDFDDNDDIYLTSGATGYANFYIKPPDNGGTATLTWSLYYDYGFGNLQLLDTFQQVVTATAAPPPVYAGNIVSATVENLMENLPAGENTGITITSTNLGDDGVLVVTPEDIPSGWNISRDATWFYGGYESIYFTSGGTENLIFYVTPPLTGGTVTLTWKLYYSKVWPGELEYLDTFQQIVSAIALYSGEILSVYPESFAGGENTLVMLDVKNTGENGTLKVSPENVPSGWIIDDPESAYVESGATEYLYFYVVPPTQGGAATLTWVLYYDNYQLDTYYQSVSATPKYSGQILSVTPAYYYWSAGENVQVTVTFKNTGDGGTLVISPEDISENWAVHDNEPDADDYRSAYLDSEENTSLDFLVESPWQYGVSGSITWKLYFNSTEGYLLDTYVYSVRTYP